MLSQRGLGRIPQLLAGAGLAQRAVGAGADDHPVEGGREEGECGRTDPRLLGARCFDGLHTRGTTPSRYYPSFAAMILKR
jgi:hypothetical protein